MKIFVGDEVEIEPHVAEWLFRVRSSTYLEPSRVPSDAANLGLVEGGFPDITLSERGRRLAETLHGLSEALVDALAVFGVQSTKHHAGVVLSFEAVDALVEKLRAKHGDSP